VPQKHGAGQFTSTLAFLGAGPIESFDEKGRRKALFNSSTIF
jgi:hypothetical protein